MSVLLHSANIKVPTPSLLALTAWMNYEGFTSIVVKFGCCARTQVNPHENANEYPAGTI